MGLPDILRLLGGEACALQVSGLSSLTQGRDCLMEMWPFTNCVRLSCGCGAQAYSCSWSSCLRVVVAGVGRCGLLFVRTPCYLDTLESVSFVSEGSSLSLLSLGTMFRELFKTSQALRCLLPVRLVEELYICLLFMGTRLRTRLHRNGVPLVFDT